MLVVLKGLRDNCKELEILDIRDNFLKEEAAEEMALLIQEIKTLHSLNISDCNLAEDENKVIIDAIEVFYCYF